MDYSDPTQMLIWLYGQILPHVPAEYAAMLSVVGTFIVSLASLISFFWAKKAPATTSKLYPVYQIVSKLGLYGNHTADSQVITSTKDSSK